MRFLKRFRSPKPPELRGLDPGPKAETWVAYLYEKNGYKILERNYALFGKKQLGELDIVCEKGNTLVAVEVRSKTSETFMRIEESIDQKKRHLLRRMILLFVRNFPEYEDYHLRVDVAAVLLDPLDKSIASVRITENVIEDE